MPCRVLTPKDTPVQESTTVASLGPYAYVALVGESVSPAEVFFVISVTHLVPALVLYPWTERLSFFSVWLELRPKGQALHGAKRGVSTTKGHPISIGFIFFVCFRVVRARGWDTPFVQGNYPFFSEFVIGKAYQFKTVQPVEDQERKSPFAPP